MQQPPAAAPAPRVRAPPDSRAAEGALQLSGGAAQRALADDSVRSGTEDALLAANVRKSLLEGELGKLGSTGLRTLRDRQRVAVAEAALAECCAELATLRRLVKAPPTLL